MSSLGLNEGQVSNSFKINARFATTRLGVKVEVKILTVNGL